MSDEAPSKTIRMSRQGRITIPAEFRTQLGIDERTMFLVSLVGDELRIIPVRIPEADDDSRWLDELYAAFAPIREDILRRGISEEEINADIDAAIAEVRAEQRDRAKCR